MKKKKLGQYNTINKIWDSKEIQKFINDVFPETIYDPFAGNGDLLYPFKEKYQIKGYDIDQEKGWDYNDSLKYIPPQEKSIIITNPPYLYKSRAKRMGFTDVIEKYFRQTKFDNLYLLAIEKALENNDNAIFIIPESFTNKMHHFEKHIHSINVLEENPFSDTEVPVCVVCFSKKLKNKGDVYKNGVKKTTVKKIKEIKKTIKPHKKTPIQFNKKNGWLAIRLFDPKTKGEIKFGFKEDFNYDWSAVKVSSRNYTLVSIGKKMSDEERKMVIKKANSHLKKIREETSDLILTAFKGNNNSRVRRRRLDFSLARYIIEESLK